MHIYLALLLLVLGTASAREAVTYILMTKNHLDRTTIAHLQGLSEVQEIVMGSGYSIVNIARYYSEVERVVSRAGYEYILEENVKIEVCADTPHWNLDRLDENDYPLNGAYTPIGTGTDITIYVLDTGVNIAHQDFQGRAEREYKAEAPCSSDANAQNHGTWVASIAAGDSYGVARRATINDVKLPNGASCDFTTVDAVQALIWLLTRPAPFVVTMSWNTVGGGSICIDSLVSDLRQHGAFMVAAAGNGNTDNGACLVSPARAQAALTVASSATTGLGIGLGVGSDDIRSGFSNYGDCIWGFAPGSNIAGAAATSLSGSVNMSGTSAAVPHVAGMAAQLMTRFDLTTPDEIDIALAERAVINKVSDARGTTNRLLNLSAAGILQPMLALLLLAF